MTTNPKELCPRCRNKNSCAIEANPAVKHCWCMDKSIPPIKNLTAQPSEACYCRQCLQEFVRNE